MSAPYAGKRDARFMSLSQVAYRKETTMPVTILGRTLRNALLSGLFLGCSALAAQAAPAAPPPASAGADTTADRAADHSAGNDLRKALAALAKGDRRSARDLLERADTALLNREALDLGAALQIDHPLPETALRQQVEQARADLHGSSTAKASGAVKRALAAVDADAAPYQSS
jgi:hypothetical protein